jgi:ATP-binding cassette, subfamily F, member 3
MLTVSRMTKSFGGRVLFEDASLQVNPGERVGLIGPNGAGKSTLFSLILGEASPDAGTVTLRRGTTIGYLPQESAPSGDETVMELAMGTCPAMRDALAVLRTVPDEGDPAHMAAHDVFLENDGYAVEVRAKRVLAGLAFRGADYFKPARSLSGGWIMRAHLARLLVMEPELLMLDEPTNHLDLESLGWFQNYLTSYPGAILAISHDRSFLNALCTATVEISRARLTRYTGNFDRYLAEKRAREEQYAAAYRNQQREIAHLQDFVNRFRAKASKASQAQERLKRLEKMERLAPPEAAEATVRFRFPQPPRSGQKVITLRGIRQAYGSHVVYDGLDLVIERGQRTVLVGPNGAGKSTLLKILAGLLPLEAGERTPGHNASIGYFAQHRTERLRPEKTVLDEASDGVTHLGEQAVRTVLGSFLFRGEDVFKTVGVLSGGEKSRLALAKLLLHPPNLMLLDEPTTHLDMPSIDALVAALGQYAGTLLFVSHDVHFIRSLATSVIHVHAGTLTTYPGGYDYYLEKAGATSARHGLVAPLGDARPAENTAPAESTSKTGGMKEIRAARRAQAEARKAEQKARREAEAKVAEAEREVLALETRQKELTAALEAGPVPSDAFALNRELLEVTEALEAANARWEHSASACAA